LAGWAAAAAFVGTNGRIEPGDVDFGGRAGMSNGADSLSGVVGGVAFSTATDGTSVMRAGLLQTRSYPGRVDDLSGLSLAESSINLSWTAPGYDGVQGALQPGSKYLIQRETSSSAPLFFGYAQVSIDTEAVNPGDFQEVVLDGLDANTTYYIGFWTQDADGNLSPLANGTTVPTFPVAVSGTSFKNVFVTSATLTWLPLPSSPLTATAEGYKVEASSTDFGAYLPGGAVLSSATPNVKLSTLTVAGLMVDTTYYFRVGSLGHDGRGNFAAAGSSKTKAGAVAPGNARVASVSMSSVSLAWTSVNSDMGYLVESSTSSDFTGTIYSTGTSQGAWSSLVSTGMLPNTTFYFRVAALWQEETKYSATLATATLAPGLAAVACKNVFITSATLNWSALPGAPPDASSKTAEGYVVEASSTDFGGWLPGGAVLSSRTANVGLSTLTVTGLAVNTTYYFRVASLNWADMRHYAALDATSTLASFPGAGSPALSAVSVTSAAAAWNAGSPANPDGTWYYLQASSKDFASDAAVVTSVTANLGGVISGLLPDATYQFRVRVLNFGGIPADTVLGTTVTWAHPPVEPAVSAVFTSSVSLSWTQVACQGYRLEASSTNFGAAWPGGAVYSSAAANGDVSGLVVQNLDPNTTYYFRVASLNWNSHPNFALAASTVTKASAPTQLMAYRVYETSATINWKALDGAPQSAGSEGYVLEASSTDFGASWPGGAVYSSRTASVGLSTLTVSGLSADTTYYFRVGSLDWGGAANYGERVSSSTLAAAPSGPAFSAIYRGSATVSWTPVACQGYELDASVSPSFSPLLFSSTTSGGASSLTVGGLASDTTYYFRVGSINHDSRRNFLGLEAASTLAEAPVSPGFAASGVFYTSATAQWTAVTAQGYSLECSTAADFSGSLISSVTYNGAVSWLTDYGLDTGTTYYFRVGSLNHQGAANYAVMGATMTKTAPKKWVGGVNLQWNTAANWSPSGVPGKNDSVTINVPASVDASVTGISFSSLTLGSPGGGVAVALTMSTGVTSGGSVIIYKDAGLTLATLDTIRFNGDLTMVSGSSLSHRGNAAAQSYEADLEVSGLFDLQAGASVTAVGVGYRGGAANQPGSGPKPGGGTSINNTGGGGAGHGGAGSGGTGGTGGGTSDAAANPVELGSGGGGGRIAAGTGRIGGAGGGLFKLDAAAMRLYGLVAVDGADGGSGTGSGGGGAGGAVNLSADVFEGTGTILARGGAGGDALGGGGGGGLISVHVRESGSACNLSFDVTGGTGTSASGGRGVVSTTATIVAPSGFSGASPTTGTIHWTWSLANGATNYRIFSSTGGDGQSPVLSAQTSFYTTTDLAANTTHSFVVRALSCGQSADSSAFDLSTLAQEPQSLARPVLGVYQSSATLAWGARPFSPQAQSSEGYVLEASSAADFSGTVFASATAKVQLSTLTVSGLWTNTTYYFRAASLNWAWQRSAYVFLGSTSTLAGSVAQAQIYGVYGTSLTVNWRPLPASPPEASSNTAEGYRLEVSTSADFSGAVRSSATPSVELSTLTVDGLDSETGYYARVGGLNWNSAAAYVSAGYAVSRDTTPPGAVSGLAAQTAASSTTLSLGWTASGNNGALGCVSNGRYRVDYATYAGHAFSTAAFQVDFSTSFCPGDAQALTLHELLPNTTYFVRVYALDPEGLGGPLSSGATAPTLARPVSALPETYLGVFQSSVTAAWSALALSPPEASSMTAEGYRLEASTAADFGGTLFSSFTSQVAASTLTIGGLAAEATYYFRVASLNWNSRSNYISLGSTKTVAYIGAPPNDARVSLVRVSSVTLAWVPVNSDGYVAQASTAADYSGAIYSSSTSSGGSSALSILGLDPNTTYYMHVGAIWGQTTSYAEAGSTSTLALAAAGLAFERVFFTSATVSWLAHASSPPDASSMTAEGYVLECSTAANFTGTVYSSGTSGVALSTLTVPGLAVNTTYYYRVGSLNWNGATNYALLGASATLASPPAAGSPLFTGVFLSSVTAQWTSGSPPNPAGTRYLLQGSSTAFAPGTVVAASSTYNLFGTLAGLLPNTTYTLRVSAVNRNGVSSLSLLSSTSTLAKSVAASAETFLGVFETSATVSWAALPASPPEASSMTAEGYRLEASSTNFGAAWPGGAVYSSMTPNVELAALTLTGLERNTTYYYRAGSLNWNLAANYFVLGSSSTKSAPPTQLMAYRVYETSATINWKALDGAPQSAGSEGYVLEASSTDFGASWPGGAVYSSRTASVGLSTLTVSGLSADTTYYFRVGSLDWGGAANYGERVSSSTLAAAPSGPAFSAIYRGSATVSWTPVACQGYELDASVSPSFSPLLFSSTTSGGASSLTVGGLASDTTYYFRVGSINHDSRRNFLGLEAASTLAEAPVSPGFAASGVFYTSATAQWTAVTAQGYSLECSTAADFSGSLISSVTYNGAVSWLTDYGLDTGTTYYFRVGSLNHQGAANYAVMGATMTKTAPKKWVGGVNLQWNTAANWSPSGVPGKNDSVTINVPASVDASVTGISFSSLTLGSPGGGVAVALTMSTGVTSGGSVIIYKDAGLTLATLDTIRFNGDLTMVSGSSLSHRGNAAAQSYEADLEVSGLFDLQAGASVTAVGVGYRGGAANQPGSGPKPGGGTSINNTGGGGAGHGGAGSGGTGGTGGGTSDAAANPVELGSGGGGGRIAAGTGRIGGAGGGLFKLDAAAMRLYGLVAVDGADGGSGTGSGGGGAGGAVNLSADVFEGTGTILARGGAGGDALGGGGGGGLISVHVRESGSACNLSFDVTGGTGTSASGGRGVVSTTATIVAPSGFSGASPTTGTIHWTWSLANGATNYRIFSSTGGDGQSPVLSAQTSFYTTTDLAANTTHSFVVRALSCGQSADSSAFDLSTLAQEPQSLARPVLGVYQSSATLAWGARPFSPQAQSSEGYVLEASSAADFSGTVFASATAKVQLSTLTVSGLWTNTTYYFRAASLNWAWQRSAYVFLGSTSTLAGSVAQAQIYGVYGTSLTVNWRPLPASPPEASSNTAEGYRLEVSTSADFSGAVRSSATPSVELSTLTVDGLDSETGYYARVGGLNWNSAAAYVSAGYAVSRDTTPPGAVSGLAAQTAASSTTLSLGWTASGNNGALGCVSNGRYRVDYATYAGHAFSTAAFQVDFSTSFCPGDAQALTLHELLPNTTYFVRVYALDPEGLGGPLSSGATAPTLARPAAGSQIYAVHVTSITVNWNALPQSPPEASSMTAEGYILQASLQADFNPVLASSISYGAALSTLSIVGLDGGYTYFFRVGTLNWAHLPKFAVTMAQELPAILGVSIDNSAWAMGMVLKGSVHAMAPGNVINVVNTGNVGQTYRLNLVGEPNATWSSTAGNPAPEAYRFSAIFSDGPAPEADWFVPPDDAVLTSGQPAGASAYAHDGEGDAAKGFGVPAGSPRKLWLKFEAPTETGISTAQSIVVRLTAQ